MNEVIEKHVKKNVDGRRTKVGVVVARKHKVNNTLCIGYSLANHKAGDTFDLSKGRKIAIERTNAKTLDVPQSLKSDVKRMIDRGQRYFKNASAGIGQVIDFNNG